MLPAPSLPRGVTVAQVTLDHFVMVQIHARQPALCWRTRVLDGKAKLGKVAAATNPCEAASLILHPPFFRMRPNRAIVSLIIAFGATGSLMAAAPSAPTIVEPNIDGAIISPFDVHMAIKEEFTDADGNTLASTDWEIRRSSDQALQWSAYGISDLRIWHVHFGDGNFSNAGRTALDAQTGHVLRVRFNDSAGEQSDWTARPFTTGRLEEVFPLKLTDIETSPAPSGSISTRRARSCCRRQPHRTPYDSKAAAPNFSTARSVLRSQRLPLRKTCHPSRRTNHYASPW